MTPDTEPKSKFDYLAAAEVLALAQPQLDVTNPLRRIEQLLASLAYSQIAAIKNNGLIWAIQQAQTEQQTQLMREAVDRVSRETAQGEDHGDPNS